MRATMPKAPIYKNSDPLAYKGNVRLSNDALDVLLPSFQPHSSQHGT
jgi:hypothetical protein